MTLKLDFTSGKDRTVASKIVAANNSVQKTRADYICTGSNDQNTINTAITALATNGGAVYLLEGTYNISGRININQHNIALIGTGSSTRIIASQGTYGIYITAKEFLVENLYLNGGSFPGGPPNRDGIYCEEAYSDPSDTTSNLVPSKGIIRDCLFEDWTGRGVYSAAVDVSIISCYAYNSTTTQGVGFQVANERNLINSCNVIGCEYGFILSNRYHALSDCMVSGCSNSGIRLHGVDDSVISNNVSLDNTLDGIRLAGNADRNNIIGNRCTGNAGYGINISVATCDDNAINKNHVQGNTTGAVNDAGTNTYLNGNYAGGGVVIGGHETTEAYTASSCTGADGAANRTLTLANTALTTIVKPHVDGLRLRETIHFTVVHNAAGSVITFLHNIWNDQNISVDYYT